MSEISKESQHPEEQSPAAEKPIWRVLRDIQMPHLSQALNMLADEGYQIRDILPAVVPEDHRFREEQCVHVVAFDAARLMSKQSKDMQAQMNALLGIPMGTPSLPK